MPESVVTRDEPLPLQQALHINEVCDRFESAWQSAGRGGPPPRIEDHVGDTPEAGRLTLLRQLVLLDIDYRAMRGERLAAEDYLARFPGLFLADALPAPQRQEYAAPEAPRGPQEEADPSSPTTVLPHPVLPGMRSERYVVRQFHARGGIGEVWLAEDGEIGRTVALKRLRKQLEEYRDRFLAEAQVTGQLEHPGIVPVHDLGLDQEGQPFYIMTFVHGRTLRDAIDDYHAKGQPGPEAAELALCRLLEAFVQVCQAVAYAHSRGVIHRDLKPDNVMLGAYGETLVLDWGLAKVRGQPAGGSAYPAVQLSYSGGSTQTQAGMVMGSPPYMAPEMAEGRADDADERTDVYLLGATLYHLLTGRLPRQGTSASEVMELARTSPPPPPRKLKPEVPRALEAICLRAMAHRRPDRYAGALDLAEDVRRYLAGAPVSAYREPLSARAWRWCRRHRRVLARSVATAAAVLALALLAGFEVRKAWREAEAARQQAEKERRNREEAEREADRLRRSDQARHDLAEFRRLADERQFYGSIPVPAAEHRLHYDSPRGDRAGQKALEVGDRLVAEIDDLVEERDAFRQEFHDLLLLTVQDQLRKAPGPEAVRDLSGRLDRALSLRGPSRGACRLRARCYRLSGEEKRADEEARRAEAGDLPETALDHFLRADECRAEAAVPAAGADRADWHPNTALLSQAVDHYRQAVRLNPRNYWAYFHLGRCYLSLGQGSEAVEAMDTCVALRPDKPWGYSARGLTKGLTQGLASHFAEGETDLERALELEPGFAPALLNRGVLAWLQRHDDRALADFGTVLELPAERRLIEAAYYRAQLRLERGELEKARQDLDDVAKEDAAFRPVYLSRAQVYFLQGDDDRGLADLSTFLDYGGTARLDPRGPELFAQRGHLLRHLLPAWLPPAECRRKLELARDSLNRAVERGGRAPELFDDLGAVLELLGEPEKALAVYEKALETAPAGLKVKLLLRRAQLFLTPAHFEQARDSYTAVVHLDPGNAEAHAGLGYVFALQRSAGPAQREAAEALLHGGGDYLILHWVACIYAQLSQVQSGEADRHQDLAMGLLRQAVKFAGRQGAAAAERASIAVDEAFRPLQGRSDFRMLVRGE